MAHLFSGEQWPQLPQLPEQPAHPPFFLSFIITLTTKAIRQITAPPTMKSAIKASPFTYY